MAFCLCPTFSQPWLTRSTSADKSRTWPSVVILSGTLGNALVGLPNEFRNFPFILGLVVLTIKVLEDRQDVRKRPSTFREVQHFALGFGERDVLPPRFLDNLGDEELFGFPPAVECLHVADFTPVPIGRRVWLA